MLPGLSEGRVVRYVYAAEDLPKSHWKLVGTAIAAVVVNAFSGLNRDDGFANLTGYTDGPNHGLGLVIRLEGRTYSPHGEPGTWYWPQDGIVPRPAEATEAVSQPSPESTEQVVTPEPSPEVIHESPAEPPVVVAPVEPIVPPPANAVEAAQTL